jgi:hypothetical protein
MKITIRDPLKLLPYQTGLVAPPLQQVAAVGQSPLDVDQRVVVLGDPVPIVFCRRLGGVGGVFVSPAATEGRFQNNASTNVLTVRLQLVLSEGNVQPLQLRDVFQRACRVGTWKQSYNARTQNWVPGNFIVAVAGTEFWDAPVYCGTGGTYANMTTVSYLNTHDDGDETWSKQVHCFVRRGMQVTRIRDNIFGPSNNLIDLALYLIRQTSRFPEAMINLDEMLTAANFCNANSLFYNGVFNQSTNLEDWLEQTSRGFLLRTSDRAGKKTLRPRLPFNDDHTIKTTVISWVFTFSEDHVLPDGFEINYIPLSERKPICAQMLWRQQPDDDIGIIRSTEVRFDNQALNGPFEQYDLSEFCTSENHAVKVGAYNVARRQYIEHTLRLRVRPDSFNSTLALGDIVRVLLNRETTPGVVTLHNYLYEVERIDRDISGVVELDLTHFPVNSQGQSILALLVNDAVGAGFQLPTGRADFSCDDEGRRDDTTELESDSYTDPSLPGSGDFGYDLPPFNPFDPNNPNAPLDPSNPYDPFPPGGGFDSGGGPVNPSDPLDEPVGNPITGATGLDDRPIVGDNLNLVPPCPEGKVDWYRVDKTTDERIFIKSDPLGDGWEAGSSLSITADDTNFGIEAEASCPDPGSPSGFGTPVVSSLDLSVQPDVAQWTYARWKGTVQGVSLTTDWVNFSDSGAIPNAFLTISGALEGTFFGNIPITSSPFYDFGEDNPLADLTYWNMPPYGPVRWRASVLAIDNSIGSGGLDKYLGGLGINGNANFSNPAQPVVSMPSTTQVGITYEIQGEWEFSQDQSTVGLVWEGDTLSSTPF